VSSCRDNLSYSPTLTASQAFARVFENQANGKRHELPGLAIDP
jgi:hypothetical protein